MLPHKPGAVAWLQHEHSCCHTSLALLHGCMLAGLSFIANQEQLHLQHQ